ACTPDCVLCWRAKTTPPANCRANPRCRPGPRAGRDRRRQVHHVPPDGRRRDRRRGSRPQCPIRPPDTRQLRRRPRLAGRRRIRGGVEPAHAIGSDIGVERRADRTAPGPVRLADHRTAGAHGRATRYGRAIGRRRRLSTRRGRLCGQPRGRPAPRRRPGAPDPDLHRGVSPRHRRRRRIRRADGRGPRVERAAAKPRGGRLSGARGRRTRKSGDARRRDRRCCPDGGGRCGAGEPIADRIATGLRYCDETALVPTTVYGRNMAHNVAQKLIAAHLVSGEMTPGTEIALRIDQTLTQDATGTMVMLELEALGLERAQTEVSVQYVDHNLLQAGSQNAEDHDFLRSACRKWGLWYSKPGNGVSHPTHMQRFGIPGKTMVGSDSHTPAAGSLGMLAMGVGGIEVARAIAGQPVYLQMPEIWGVRLTGSLPSWVSAKDVILEMLRRHGVKGATNRIIEYHGPGLANLTAMDRHVIANMGAELGATTTVFPSDEKVRDFLSAESRADDYVELLADTDAGYDVTDEIHLSDLEPLIALPSSPGNVVHVSDVAGRSVEQVVIGSSANPGLRDFAIAAAMVKGRQ